MEAVDHLEPSVVEMRRFPLQQEVSRLEEGHQASVWRCWSVPLIEPLLAGRNVLTAR